MPSRTKSKELLNIPPASIFLGQPYRYIETSIKQKEGKANLWLSRVFELDEKFFGLRKNGDQFQFREKAVEVGNLDFGFVFDRTSLKERLRKND